MTAASKADSGKGRLAGTLLMGLAFTLTSFTCTAPFLGTLLVVASQGDWQWPLAGMLAFSSVFALPFVILAFVPQALASLPRSGPWLLAVKAVMGIIELAAAMKFISNVDLVWGWNIFTRNVVVATWVVLSVVLVAYLAGWIRLGPVPRLKRPGIGRWGLTTAAAVLAIWLGTGLTGNRLGEIEAFLPPANLAAMAAHGELPWGDNENNYEKALAEARAKDQRDLHRLHRLHLHELPLDGSQHVPAAGGQARALPLRAARASTRTGRANRTAGSRRWKSSCSAPSRCRSTRS